MNSLNFLIVLGLFSIFWLQLDGVEALPTNQNSRFFNYDDDFDYFQLRRDLKPCKAEESESPRTKNEYQMPYKPVPSEDDSEMALMSDMSIYTDDDVAWEQDHGRSGVVRGLVKNQAVRSPPAVKKPKPMPRPIYAPYPYGGSKSYGQMGVLDSTDMTIGKWNWMEKILRQQAEGLK